jgi:sortase A
VRRWLRISGSLLLGAGVLTLAWVAVVWQWQDPFTALYSTYQQQRLAAGYEARVAAFEPAVVPERRPTADPDRPSKPSSESPSESPSKRPEHSLKPVDVRAEQRLVALEARRYRRSLQIGDPVGRLRVPRMGLTTVVVAGTSSGSLTKGPGWYPGSYLPGEGELIYVAGHRTTYGAPFAQIESMRPGDLVTMEVPYGTFIYRVTSSVIVPADDLARLTSHGRELLALQACHPRFFASHRYIVYAKPMRVLPRSGRPYRVVSAGATPASSYTRR